MKWLVNALSTSVGKKFVMAITGLLLCGFLVVHLGGNLLLFFDDDGQSYNDYAHQLHDNAGLLLVAQIGLYILFALHIVLAIVTARENEAARDVRYQMKNSKISDRLTIFRPDTWMFISGAIILGFLILHLIDFKFAVRPDINYEAYGEDRAARAIGLLQNPITKLVYAVGCIALGLHLAHGVASAFQSLGANHPKYSSWIRWGGYLFAVIIAIGFISFPILFGWFPN